MLFCTQKLVLKISDMQIPKLKTGSKCEFSRCTNINNHLICFETKNSLHTTQISSFKLSFSRKADAKIYIMV